MTEAGRSIHELQELRGHVISSDDRSEKSLPTRLASITFRDFSASGLEMTCTPRNSYELGPPVCTLSQISALDDRGGPVVQEVSLQLQAGEIFGIAGVDGNGQKELGEVIAGQRRIVRGQMMLAGVDLTNPGRGGRSSGRHWL
ncbi:MAG: hypothetical protein HC875_41015, partial [Anaerolineales bacterium]|nr:hypothetical protein [Anaerolineales bacterium]